MSTASLRIVRGTEKRLPALGRFLAAPSVRGAVSSRSAAGTVWRAIGTPPRSLVIYLADSPSRWLAGSIAVRMGAVVLAPSSVKNLDATVAATEGILTTFEPDDTFELDADLTAIVAENAVAGLALCRMRRVARLALISPTLLPSPVPVGVPTTLVQASESGAHRPGVVAFVDGLRAAGVAVRETGYRDIPDGWAGYPRLIPGSRRALNDLVGFLERGVGRQSDFTVIPGWDLH